MNKNVVEIDNLSFKYLGQNESALRDVNLKIKQGEIVAIVGPTGAGKSSLLRTLNGLVPHEFPGSFEGNVIVCGLNTKEHTISELARHVGIVLENPSTQIFSPTIEEDVAFGPANLGLSFNEIVERVKFSLEACRLKGLESRSPHEISGGQQQALAIAGVLAMRPSVLALDEVLAMLDPVGKELVMSILTKIASEQKSTIILAESGADIESIAKFVRKIIVLNRGEVLKEGTPRQILSSQLLDEIGVGSPQVSELFLKLRKLDPNLPIPITVEEAIEYSKKLFMLTKKIKGMTRQPEMEQKIEKRNPAIMVRNLWHVYEGGVEALKGVSLNIYPGEMIAIIGQNGSGKTTLAYHLVGLLKPTNPDAKVIVDGIDVTKSKIGAITQRINYVFQNPDEKLFCEKVFDEISFGLKFRGRFDAEKENILKTLKLFGLEDYRDEYIAKLPRNLKRLLAIAAIAALGPKHMIIDEPTTGLDNKTSEKVLNILSKLNSQGHTVIVITHNMNIVAKYCKRVLVMKDGKIIIDGPTKDVFTEVGILKEAYITPPQIAQLSVSIFGRDGGMVFLSVEEALDCFARLMEG